MQFGAKPLFENVSVKFGAGNRYGLIGANGCGKSTFMKILGGDLDPTGGQGQLEPQRRLGKLRQDQFAYEDHARTRHGDDGSRRAVEGEGERDPSMPSGNDRRRLYDTRPTWKASSPNSAAIPPNRAPANCCTAWASAIEQHNGPMSAVSPGWKLRVLLAQVLFADPE